ncbi:hypothetical protein [Nakamurella lactea]|uniref:hypothetical protein n=1 Tax=Nakamurella lactea TaxID=459515 RepID=UPI0003FF837A|nr:hypothetical protein [Nakamurella lactea]
MTETPSTTWEPGTRRELAPVRGTSARDLAVWEQVESGVPGGQSGQRRSEPGIVGLLLTGYLDTEVRARMAGSPDADRFRWSFGPGIERSDPLRSAPVDLRLALSELPDTGCRVSMGWVDGDRRHHLAPGRASLASHLTLLHGNSAGAGLHGTTVRIDDLVRTAGGLGDALRMIHSVDPAHAEGLPAPSGPTRLARWLRSGEGPWSAEFMHDRLVSLLGTGRTEEIISWVHEMPQQRVVHGRAGLSAIVVPESPASPALLTGDEIAYGPEDFDLAWVLGELLVQDHLTDYLDPAAAARQRAVISECRDAFLVAYGPAKDIVVTGRTATLRVLVELHDAAAFQDRQLTDLAAQVPELVDAAR